jgi:PadR family transcriptional regulator, regulatory protein PadR
MRLTFPLAKLAADLLSASPDQLYALSISRRTGLVSGVIVPKLHAMETAGWLVSTWEEITSETVGRPRRRYYRVTERGYRELGKLMQRVQSERRFTLPLAGDRT